MRRVLIINPGIIACRLHNSIRFYLNGNLAKTTLLHESSSYSDTKKRYAAFIEAVCSTYYTPHEVYSYGFYQLFSKTVEAIWVVHGSESFIQEMYEPE